MKLDTVIKTKLLGMPYRPSQRRFNQEKKLALQSASIVVNQLLDLIPVKSVIDIGCGVGFWLRAFADRGVKKIIGIDGDYTDRTRLAIDPSCFIARDLNRPAE
jgi:2-polyprenyl-3-methyl-5-hydroxy-6-metoxy-1,4-benzoquinol methylase